MKRNDVLPRSGTGETTPQGAAAAMLQLNKVIGRLGLAGVKIDQPPEINALPELAEVRDPALLLRGRVVMAAAELFPNETKPVAAQVKEVAAAVDSFNAAWALYEVATAHALGTADLQLALGPAHRLVRRRLLDALLDVLDDPALEQGERDALEVLLGEIRVVLGDEETRAQASRDKSRDVAAAAAEDLDALRAEEELLDVMLAMRQGETPSLEELVRAGRTFSRGSVADGAPAEEDEDEDRRGRGR